jgi:hypothetical protein
MKDVYAPYLTEWLEHHRALGVDWFFIYDNDSAIPLTNLGDDVIIQTISGSARQIAAYEACLADVKKGSLPTCDRVAFIDEDEFIICENNDIKKSLEAYADYPAIGLTWRVFGSSGLKKKTPIPQRQKFTQHTTGHPYERHIKSIIDPLRTIGSSGNPHVFSYLNGQCVNVDKIPIDGPFTTPTYHTMWIDHYYTRSLEEWKEKVEKGRSDTVTGERDFWLIDEIDTNCSGAKRKIHLIMPYSRRYLWDKLIKAYGPMNVILHPLTLSKEDPVEIITDWIQPMVSSSDEFNQSTLINDFIQSGRIIDDDYYVTVSDDDMYEQGVFDAIRNMDDPIIIISMKRGYRVPPGLPAEKRYPPTTLLSCPGNVKVGCIGGEQIFMKGLVLKTLNFDESVPAVADGLVAEYLKTAYPIRYEPKLFALFNFYEPERWKQMDGGLAFGVMVNDLVRLDMCLKQSQIDPTYPCHTVLRPESATKGLNKLLDIIEGTGADVAVLVHQDMYFLRAWPDQVISQLAKLPKNWMCAGVIGKDMTGRMCGKFHDTRIPLHFNTSDIHRFPHPACCFDEAVIIVNLKTGFRFDESFEGFDLYGTLIVLQAWERGLGAYIIDAWCSHHCLRPFTWEPDDLFVDNYKRLYDKYKAIRVDSTALGLPPDGEVRFETSAGPERTAQC